MRRAIESSAAGESGGGSRDAALEGRGKRPGGHLDARPEVGGVARREQKGRDAYNPPLGGFECMEFRKLEKFAIYLEYFPSMNTLLLVPKSLRMIVSTYASSYFLITSIFSRNGSSYCVSLVSHFDICQLLLNDILLNINDIY